MSVLKAKKSDGGWAEIHSVKAMAQSTGDFTQDATATADDIVEGKTAYAQGIEITGTIPAIDDIVAEYPDCDIAEVEGGGIYVVKHNDTKYIRTAETYDVLWLQKYQLGDATIGDVISGKTFTSANGLRLTGTYVPTTTTVNLQTKTVSPTTKQQIVKPDSGYTGLSQVTVNAMTNGDLGTPSISVSANGVITATANVSSSGYLAAGTTKNNTLTLSSAYDSDFVASNIRSGKTIFGVTGTYTGSGSSSSSLPAGISCIASGIYSASSDVTSGTITHNLGVVPNFIVWEAIDDYSVSPGTSCAISGVSWIMPIISGTSSSYTYAYAIKGYNSSSTLTGTHSAGGNHYATTTTARLMASSSYKLLKGKQYRWVCGVMDV